MESSDTDSLIESTSIVIIGAGIAGLGAAITLEKSNFKDYILVEAQSYYGGRICSIPWNGKWIEKGAQFLHGRGSTLAQLAEERGFLSDEHVAEGEGLYLREDGTEVDRKLVLEVDDIVKDILEDCEKYASNNEIYELMKDNKYMEESIGKLLKNRFQKYLRMSDDPPNVKSTKEELFDWNAKFLVIDNACSISIDELSVKGWGKFKAVSGPEHNIFNTHYSSIVESITGELTQDNLRLNTPVEKIEWNDKLISKDSKSVIVTLKGNRKISANCAIITCSLGFLKENHDKFFSPILPFRFTSAIQSLGFGTINKVFLDFEEPWWEPNVKGFQFLWKVENNECNNDSARDKLAPWVYDLTGFDMLKNNKAVLLGWVGGKGALIIETLSEQQIIKDCAKLFRFFLKNDNVPEACKCLRTNWASNQYVRGGYSHIATKCDSDEISPSSLAEPIWGTTSHDERLPVLMLAGEGTHEHYYSTTHGAYDSGVRQAQTFLRYRVTK